MAQTGQCVVTGATGYIGKYITRALLARGARVTTLTGHPDRPSEFGGIVEVKPFSFINPEQLTDSLKGAHTLYNTYWIRFPMGEMTFERAVANSRTLIRAAEEAGVRRIVHISVTKADRAPDLPYYAGKAQVEEVITSSKLSYAILRPNIVFGDEGILINNLAWFLRHMPVFAIPGSGEYKVQPVFVEDLAEMAVGQGESSENVVMDAVGPEAPTFNELMDVLKRTVGSRALIIHVPPAAALASTLVIGKALGDVIMTPEEVKGLLANLLVSDGPPTAPTRLSDWLAAHRDAVGRQYFSELKRRR